MDADDGDDDHLRDEAVVARAIADLRGVRSNGTENDMGALWSMGTLYHAPTMM